MTRKYRPSELAVKIDQAADLLEESGWCRGKLKNASGHHCVVGAVYAVCGVNIALTEWNNYEPDDEPSEISNQALEVLDYACEHDHRRASVVLWNDDQRDKRKVVRFMRRTADRLRDHKIARAGANSYTEWVVR